MFLIEPIFPETLFGKPPADRKFRSDGGRSAGVDVVSRIFAHVICLILSFSLSPSLFLSFTLSFDMNGFRDSRTTRERAHGKARTSLSPPIGSRIAGFGAASRYRVIGIKRGNYYNRRLRNPARRTCSYFPRTPLPPFSLSPAKLLPD